MIFKSIWYEIKSNLNLFFLTKEKVTLDLIRYLIHILKAVIYGYGNIIKY